MDQYYSEIASCIPLHLLISFSSQETFISSNPIDTSTAINVDNVDSFDRPC